MTISFLDRQAQLGAPLRISGSNPVISNWNGKQASTAVGEGESTRGPAHDRIPCAKHGHQAVLDTLVPIMQMTIIIIIIFKFLSQQLTKSEMTLAPRWLTLRSMYILVLSLSHVRRRGWATPSGIKTRKEHRTCFMSSFSLMLRTSDFGISLLARYQGPPGLFSWPR